MKPYLALLTINRMMKTVCMAMMMGLNESVVNEAFGREKKNNLNNDGAWKESTTPPPADLWINWQK